MATGTGMLLKLSDLFEDVAFSILTGALIVELAYYASNLV